MLARRVIPVVAILCMCWAVSPPSVKAEENEVLGWRDIVRELNPPRKKGIGYESDGAPAPAPAPPRVALSAIQFEYNSHQLTGKALAQVNELAVALETGVLRTFRFAVQGHTDSVGSRQYNRGLSQRRARSVKQHLVSANVPPHRLVEVGLGEGYHLPGVPGEDDRNRRVEIVRLGSLETAATPPERRRRALLLGIDEYTHVHPLVGPVNDAKAMRSFISGDLGYADRDIRMLLNAEATRENILETFEDWLIDGTAEGDEVFLFFSGHGFRQPDEDGDEADRYDETLIPVDVQVAADGAISGMITDDEIAVLMNRLAGRQVQVVVDACHSGTSTKISVVGDEWRFVKSPRLPDGRPIRLPIPEKRETAVEPRPEAFLSTKDTGLQNAPMVVWTAVRADQKALVDEVPVDGEYGSVFTRRLLWGVRDRRADRDADGVVTQSELLDYLVQESATYCTRHQHQCPAGLTPQLDGTAGANGPAFASAAASPPSPAVITKNLLIRHAERVADEAGTGVNVRIEPGTRLAIGSPLDIVVESDRNGHLVLLDINAAGEMTQIFPNELSLGSGVSGTVRAGEPLRLPGERAGFRFKATPPAGAGILLAIVSEASPQLRELVSRHKDLAVVARPSAYLVEIDEALRAGGSDGGETIAATLAYEAVASSE